MKSIKDLFKSNHKQPLDIKPSIDDQTFEVSFNNCPSYSECHSEFEPSANSTESIQRTLIQQNRSELDNLDQASTNTHSRRRKTPEEIVQHKNDYQRVYCKAYRARKKKEIEDMKTINQLAMNALIKILNANSHLINEEDMNIINNTIDYNDRCTKIIELINKLYGTTS